MADVFFSQTRHLRAASFDLDSKSIFLNVFSKSKFQTPILAEDGIPFLEKWYRKPIALPLNLFAPTTSQFPESAQKTFLDNFCQTIRDVENGTGSQNLFLSIGLLRSQTTAPLLFVPLEMDIQNRTVSLKSAPPVENVALRIRHKDSIDLPPAKIFQDGSTFQIKKYFLAVERAVDAVAGWQSTSRGIFLGFFDAASLYAHQDFESASRNVDFAKNNATAKELLSDEGLRVVESNLDERESDKIFDPTNHYFVRILDSEANTTLLETLSSENGIEAVETPPGSAWEDFLANLISENVSIGKKVLITYKRINSRRLLEKVLHSEPSGTTDTTLEKARETLAAIRNTLFLYDRAANRPVPPGNSTLAEALIALNKAPSKKIWPDSTFSGAENLTRENFLRVQDIIGSVSEKRMRSEIKKALGAFKGATLTAIDNAAKTELLQKLQSANAKYQTLATLAESVSGEFFFDKSIDISALSHLSAAITPEFNSETPSFEGWNLESKDWETYGESLRELPSAGKAWSEFRKSGSSVYVSEAIDMPLGASREILKDNQKRKFKVFSEYYHDAKKALLKTLRNPKSVKSDSELLELTDELVRLQNCKKLYMNFSVMALRLFGKDWQFEHTDWDALESKIHWLFEFRKKLSTGEKANLSLAILSKYNSVQNHIPDANALNELCQSAKSEFGDICQKLSFTPEEDASVEEQANLIRKWNESFPQLPDCIQINIQRSELQKLGLPNLEKALLEIGMPRESLAADFSRFWNAAQIQNACKIFPSLFSISPKAHSKYAKDFQTATDDLAAMNLRHFKEALQESPQLLTILPLDEVAQSPQTKTYDAAICIDAESISPLQALPILQRSERTIFIGDSNMPAMPFSHLLGNFDRPHFIASQFESVLAYSLFKGAKRSRLSLNVRHRHPLLLDFSNNRFYGRKIQKFPPPNPTESKAIRFDVEKDPPKAIASAVTAHAKRHPTQSLGVIVLTEARRQDVTREIQRELERNPDLGRVLSSEDSLRAFYVKLPEEAVGEYRDTIFLCAESDATVAGHGISSKQINVCATHALSTLKVFAAEAPENTVSANPGVRAHQEFLHFAFHVEETSIFKSNPLSSPFEELIFQEIHSDEIKMERNWGYNDFTIPFAVRDSNNPERFLLGIDTDSGNRFLARSIEDKLYIRPKLFKHLGWKIIHLWSPNWFRSTADERNHILTTIAVEQSVAPMPNEKGSDAENLPEISIKPYEIQNPEKTPANNLPIPETSAEVLISQLQFYVNAESPIHEKNLIRRLLHFHDLHRAGPAVVRTLKDAISQGIAQKAFLKTGSFFYSTENKPIVLRDRSTLPDEERSILYVSPEERALFSKGTDDQTIRETLGLN